MCLRAHAFRSVSVSVGVSVGMSVSECVCERDRVIECECDAYDGGWHGRVCVRVGEGVGVHLFVRKRTR